MNAEMAELVFRRLNITYTLTNYNDTWGAHDTSTGTYSGMMRDIYNGVIDADISDWRESPLRLRDFHMPYLSWQTLPVHVFTEIIS